MTAQTQYAHLHLREWPFRTVPGETSSSFMADRTQVVSEIMVLLRNFSRQPDSSIHLMWAWFGAGKTHTLRYLEHLCKEEFRNIVPVYIEFPKSTKHFIDIYKAFISDLDLDLINNAYLEVVTDPQNEKIRKSLISGYPDLSNALRLLYQGSPDQQEIITRWLRTEYQEKRILRKIGIANPIDSAEDVIKVMSWLICMINSVVTTPGEIRRVLWMVDEYQRIESLRKPIIDEINGCLHAIFNKCPGGLSIIISFSGYPEQKKLPGWLSQEIKDRIGIEKPLLLHPLSKNEAFKFVEGVLAHFRSPASNIANKYYPFTKKAILKTIEIIEHNAKKCKRRDEPKPRTIMQSFKKILEEADCQIESGKIHEIDEKFVSKILEDMSLIEE